MQKKIDLYISPTAPNVRNGAAWLKPEGEGFVLYILDGGLKTLKLKEDKEIDSKKDNAITEAVTNAKTDLVGSVQDKKNANTINGAKAFAKDATAAIVGTPKDTPEDLTLNGLKAYIDKQIAKLG